MRTYGWENGKCYNIYDRAALKDLVGKTLVEVNVGDDVVTFRTKNAEYALHHEQDCCENVYIESVVGDIQDLVGEKILVAEEVSNMPDPGQLGKYDESYTWTFYKFATRKGYVDIRWYGTSNGYYSERVSFVKKVRKEILKDHGKQEKK